MRFATSLLVCLLLGAATAQAAGTTVPSSKAVVVVLGGTIDEYNKASLIKRFNEARSLGADTVILRIDTWGGLVTSGLDISTFLKRQNDIHVIAFVHEKAISAGAMIALACDEIVMEPGSKLGDCAPIVVNATGTGLETLGAAERAKMESPILEDFYDSAKRNGYDPLLVQSMVSVGRVVHWIQNEQGERRFVDGPTYEKLTSEGWTAVPDERNPIDDGTSLLTVNANLALKLGLAKAIEPSPQALATSRGLLVLSTLAPGAGDHVVGFLGSTAVRGLLTTVFLLALYMAFSHPGHGMAEVIAVVALSVLVGVPLLTGYAQWWEIVAILLGLVLLAVEVFVVPGFGLTGISGIILIILGLTMTWVGNEPTSIPGILPKLPATWTALQHGLMVIVGGMICSLILWFWLQKYLPTLPYLNKLILTTPNPDPATGTQHVTDAAPTAWPFVGARGKAETDLRPGGSASFFDPALADARLTDVISDSGYVRAGTEVTVREVTGTRVVVRAVT